MEKVIIFDFDGTLHETMFIYKPAIVSVVKWLNETCGIQVDMPSDARISSWLGVTMKDMWEDFMPELDPELRMKAGRLVGDHMQENMRKGMGRLYAGVPEMLDVLCTAGYQLAILSNCGNHHAQVQWDIYGLERWFTAFFACETWNGIPKHEIIQDIAADFAGALEKSPVKRDDADPAEPYKVYAGVGDRDSDLAAAQAIGVPFIGCLYGYGSLEELEESTFLAERPEMIAELIDGIGRF